VNGVIVASTSPDAVPPARIDTSGGERPTTRSYEAAALGVILVVAALLRLPMLGQIPNGFFLDEASRGYDAYALLQTGADQYGVRWPLFAEGLDDYTPVLYTLLVIPSVAAFGLTETAVRLPAALVGLATVGTTYLLGRTLVRPLAGLVAAALVAISPWHILPSRTGAEWVLLPLFMTVGVWLLVRGRTHGPSLLLAGIVLGVGLYSYAFARLLVPLLLVGFGALWWRDLLTRWRWALAGVVALVLPGLPLVMFGLTPAGQARLETVVPLDRYRSLALVPYFLANFASYFGPGFLLGGTEPAFYHHLAGQGPLLLAMVPLAALGLYSTVTSRSRAGLFCLWWIVAAPASAALHRESPSSALLLGAVPSWHLLCGAGAAWAVSAAPGWRLGARRLAAVLILAGSLVTAVFVGFALYLRYPSYAAEDWLYGSREAVTFLESRRSGYDDVLVSDRLPTPHVLVLFYAQVDPVTYQRAPIRVRQPNVRSRGDIGPYQFGRIQDLLERPGRHLVWVSAAEARALFGDRAPLLTITLPDGRPTQLVYEIGRT
jgi:4-amino-4-deoxy-L-arabinose transferase-like glycosyltransferase